MRGRPPSSSSILACSPPTWSRPPSITIPPPGKLSLSCHTSCHSCYRVSLYHYSSTRFPTASLRCASLPWPARAPPLNKLDLLTTRELYYLWELAGGDVKAELRQGW